MKVERLEIPDVILVTPPRFGDHRGFFSEVFNLERFAAAGINLPFIQDNQSLSQERGVVRGLHCQVAPHPQGKLVRCTRGAIWDVAVDARRGSPTFGSGRRPSCRRRTGRSSGCRQAFCTGSAPCRATPR